MAKQTIALGTVANDGTGDDLRSAGDKINDNFDELYNRGGVRGALVYRSADQTGANYSAGGNIPWTAEAYDTDGIHDNVTNNSRLTVPSGVTKVRVGCNVVLTNVTGNTDVYAAIQKNGSSTGFPGRPGACVDFSATTPRFNMTSAIIAVTAGDYFEVNFSLSDSSVDVYALESWFSMEIIE